MEKEEKGQILEAPYIDFGLYNAARVGYDMACNELRREFAGRSPYELKKALNRIRFTPPVAVSGGYKYYLVGYFVPSGEPPKKEKITLIYCVFIDSLPKIFAAEMGADGRLVCEENCERLKTACGYLNTVVNFGLEREKRAGALKRLLGL